MCMLEGMKNRDHYQGEKGVTYNRTVGRPLRIDVTCFAFLSIALVFVLRG